MTLFIFIVHGLQQKFTIYQNTYSYIQVEVQRLLSSKAPLVSVGIMTGLLPFCGRAYRTNLAQIRSKPNQARTDLTNATTQCR